MINSSDGGHADADEGDILSSSLVSCRSFRPLPFSLMCGMESVPFELRIQFSVSFYRVLVINTRASPVRNCSSFGGAWMLMLVEDWWNDLASQSQTQKRQEKRSVVW